MFLTQIYKERLQRKIQQARDEGIVEGKAEGIVEGKAEGIVEGKAEGIVEGKAEGIVEGKAEERHLWINWNNRRLAAEAKGEDFSEPPPVQSTEEQD